MYTVDKLDRVVEVQDAPCPDSGAPLPFVIGGELELFLAYLTSEPGERFSSEVKMMSADSSGNVALVEFTRPIAHMFGPPNDETFLSHPLATRGLSLYGVFEVIDSSWIRQLARMNKAGQGWSPYDEMRHFIFSFHDSTFECIAKSLAANRKKGSLREVMMQKLQSRERSATPI